MFQNPAIYIPLLLIIGGGLGYAYTLFAAARKKNTNEGTTDWTTVWAEVLPKIRPLFAEVAEEIIGLIKNAESYEMLENYAVERIVELIADSTILTDTEKAIATPDLIRFAVRGTIMKLWRDAKRPASMLPESTF